MYSSLAIPVTDQSQVGEARRAASQIAREAELSDTEAGKVSLIATELANNLQKYAKAGRILLQAFSDPRGKIVEVISIDEGPGIADPGRCQQDGFSTGGTPGSGLGAVKRVSTEFDIFSSQPKGTVVLARIHANSHATPDRSTYAWGAVSIPAPGESVCGDAWRIAENAEGAVVIVADGLGHGPLASDASQAAMKVFEADAFQGPSRLMESAHMRLSGTRGAAVAVAQLDIEKKTLRYCGIGNISGCLLTTTSGRGLLTRNGIVGSRAHKVEELKYPWPTNGLLIMYSDGLHTRIALETYPGLFSRHPGIIAAVLARDCIRGKDDATVVILRLRAGWQ